MLGLLSQNELKHSWGQPKSPYNILATLIQLLSGVQTDRYIGNLMAISSSYKLKYSVNFSWYI